jgi:hypothetical protein
LDSETLQTHVAQFEGNVAVLDEEAAIGILTLLENPLTRLESDGQGLAGLHRGDVLIAQSRHEGMVSQQLAYLAHEQPPRDS